MTEEERLQMLKTRLEKRQKQESDPVAAVPSKRLALRLHLKDQYRPDIGNISEHLNQSDVCLSFLLSKV